jgi:hypothetical protein
VLPCTFCFCSIFERALAYSGSDYLSHSLWDKYMSFEEEQGSSVTVAALYTRILNQPLKQLDRYMQRCAGHTHTTPPSTQALHAVHASCTARTPVPTQLPIITIADPTSTAS